MPTISPEPPRESHQHREMAESFGVDADRYDRARPRYPDEIIEWVVSGSPGPDLLDVGTGTGIAARQFLAAGCRVHGVEPDARMADFARRGGFEVDVSTFEEWDPAGRVFDAVVAAMAWHWVDPAAGAAKAAEVLRPGGLLAVFWNVADTPPELTAAFADVYERVLPDSLTARFLRNTTSAAAAYAPALTKAADGMHAADAFGEPAEFRYEWDQHYTRDEWLDLAPTTGTHTRLTPADLAAVLAGLGEVIDAHGGGLTVRYTTMGVAATRRSPG